VTSALHPARFAKSIELMEETLTSGSIFWQAVQRGARTASGGG
jgi:hypothetical protein